MATLLFFDADHRYTLDGEDLPSVSELCRFISREIYGDVQQYQLDNAANRGTAVHKACEVLDKFGVVDVQDDILPYMQAYVKFRKEHNIEWQKIEWAAHHPVDKVAGTVDRVGILDGDSSILDIKTTYSIDRKHKILYTSQLTWYKRICESNGISVNNLFILQLKKDATYKLIPIEANNDLALACLTLHNSLKTKPRKKGGQNVEKD